MAATGVRRLTAGTFAIVLIPLVVASAVTLSVAVATTPTDPDNRQLTAFEQSLDQMPADALNEESATLLYVDMELAWQRAGVGSTIDERLDGIGALVELATRTQPPQLFGQYAMQLEEARAEIGFTMFDVDREITVQSPPNDIIIAETRVTPEDVTAALDSDPVWSSELRMVEDANGGYFEWGDDPLAQHLERLSPMRPFGQGGQLALIGSDAEATVVRTEDPADMQSVLATVAGRADSLLDDGLLVAAVPALGEGDVLQVMAVEGPIGFDPAALLLGPEEFEELLAEMVLVEPYDGVVIGEVYDGERSQTAVVLVYPDEASAEENAALVERALAEGIDPIRREPLADLLPDAEVSTVGSAVVVTLSFEGAYSRAQDMLVRRALFPSG